MYLSGMALLATVVRRALRDVPLTPADKAAAELAIHYATAVDAGDVPLEKIGPPLLAALAALGMTPASRKALVKEASSGPTSPLDELRKRRAARAAG